MELAFGWPTVAALLLTQVASFTRPADRQPTPVYLVPQRPECEPTTVTGDSLRMALLVRGFRQPNETVTPPWAPLEAAVAASPDDPVARIDLARCLYTFARGIPELRRDGAVAQELALALDGVRRQHRTASEHRVRAPGPAPLRAGRDVPAPEKTRHEAPQYTAEAVAAQAVGTVFVDVLIDKSGNVKRVTVLGSIPVLDLIATNVVRRWKYRPTVVNGQRVEVATLVTLKFSPDPAPSAVDGMDVARFHIARAEFAEAAAALDSALGMLQAEPPAGDDPVRKAWMAEILQARDFKGDHTLTSPRVVHARHPKYTSGAMRMKIQGVVEMLVVVLTDGRVGAVRVSRSLDPVYGLDAEAVRVARERRFEPALDRHGRPMPVVATIHLEFRLH